MRLRLRTVHRSLSCLMARAQRHAAPNEPRSHLTRLPSATINSVPVHFRLAQPTRLQSYRRAIRRERSQMIISSRPTATIWRGTRHNTIESTTTDPQFPAATIQRSQRPTHIPNMALSTRSAQQSSSSQPFIPRHARPSPKTRQVLSYSCPHSGQTCCSGKPSRAYSQNGQRSSRGLWQGRNTAIPSKGV